MAATRNREIRDSKQIGTVNRKTVKSAVHKVSEANSKVMGSTLTQKAPVLRRKK